MWSGSFDCVRWTVFLQLCVCLYPSRFELHALQEKCNPVATTTEWLHITSLSHKGQFLVDLGVAIRAASDCNSPIRKGNGVGMTRLTYIKINYSFSFSNNAVVPTPTPLVSPHDVNAYHVDCIQSITSSYLDINAF